MAERRTQKRVLTESERKKRDALRRRAAAKKKRQKMIARVIVIILIIVLVVAGVVVFAGKAGRDRQKEQDAQMVETTEEMTTQAQSKEISFLAAGDVIGHDTILGLAETDDGYDFYSLFAPLANDISKVDIACVNMETPFGGEEVGPYIGYPAFNTPDEMGLALIDAGFDVVQLASNHSMDSGAQGLLHEMDFWKSHSDEIMTTGLNSSEEEKNEIPMIEKDGVKIAFLNYTYGLNGYELPDEYSYMLTLLVDENKDFIKEQIRKADEQADFVIVLPHWGTEYELKEPDDSQKEWAVFFTEAGADVIIGTHPHVIQKMDWIEAGGNKALCYYSIGNFVSNQQETETVLGVMAYFNIKSDDSGAYVEDDSASVIPIVTQNDKTDDPVKIATYYLSDYTDEMAAVHDTKLSFDEEFSVAKLNGIIDDIFDSFRIKDRIGE